MNFTKGEELLALCNQEDMNLSDVMRAREIFYLEQPPLAVEDKMRRAWEIMQEAAKTALYTEVRPMGGFIGGEAKKLMAHSRVQKPACGSLVSRAITYACGVLEVNAAMGLIVAAPTAGASGVLPGVLLALREEWGFSDEQIIHVLFNAGAIGYLFTRNATVAGAEGGCQAEVGVASAMAASAAAELLGGDAAACLQAAAMAVTNILGLVCDPAAGLVETPCQQRNAMGAANALVAAEMALAGIQNAAPFDETVEMMYRVGKAIPSALRETALGGLAACPSVCGRCKG